MDEDGATLSVGFAIDTGGAFSEVLRFSQMFDENTLRVIQQAAAIEKATGNMVAIGRATADIRSFGAESTRALQAASREAANAERAGERLVAQLERQNAAYGKTREQLRATKVEETALAAERTGNADLARRLREQEQALTGQEIAAVRRAQQAADDIAETKVRAAAEAAAASEKEAQAIRDAAHAYDLFEAKVRAGAAAMRERDAAIAAADGYVGKLEAEAAAIGRTTEQMRAMEVAARAAAAEQAGLPDQAARIRAAGAAFAETQARAKSLADDEQRLADIVRQAAREQQAATTAADGYAAKLEAEAAAIGRTTDQLREMEIAQRAAAAEAAGLPDQAARIRAAGVAYGEAQARAAALAAEERRLADAARATAEATRQAAAAEAAQNASIDALRGSVDPLYGSQQRLTRELQNAARLYRDGAISQGEYERSSQTLAQRLIEVEQAQARAAAGAEDVSRGAKLGAHDLTNIIFQLQDIGVSLAGGQNPLLVMIQQGSQLSGIMLATGASVGDMAKAVLGLFIVTKPTAAAAAALAAAELALAAAQTASTTTGVGAAVSAAELAVAQEVATAAAAKHGLAQTALTAATAAAAAAGVGDAAAQAALTAAQLAAAASGADLVAAQGAVLLAEGASTTSADLAAAAARRLAVAQGEVAAASTTASATAIRALAPWLAALWPVVAAAAAAAVAIKLLEDAANEGAPVKKYAESLGLTAKQIRELKDVTVTWGDTAKAVFQVAGEAIWSGVGTSVTSVWAVMKEWLSWLASAAKTAVNFTIGAFVGGYNAIKLTWGNLPAVMGDLFYSAVNYSIEAINSLIRKTVDGVNGFIDSANGVLAKVGLKLPDLSAPQIAQVNNQFAGAGAKAGKSFNDEVKKAVKFDYVGAGVEAVLEQAKKNAEARTKKEAEKKGFLDPKKPKEDTHAESLAREAAAVEAQIAGLYRLADAYKISGAAALIAEAREKAESAAIKKRGDIEEFVARQVRLAIAQRVADAAKATAAMNDQAAIQEAVNAKVEAGLIPAARAAQLIQDQTALLPLLAAQQAAKMTNDALGYANATAALDDMTAAQKRSNAAKAEAALDAASSAGQQQIAQLQEELRLVSATDEARARALATLKATQDLAAWGVDDPAKAAAYIKQQADIAAMAVTNAQAQDAYNASLTQTADHWDIIAGKVKSAAQGMADAFGASGRAISDVAAIFADYQAQRTRAEAEHAQQVKKAGGNQILLAQEADRYALQSSAAQIAAYGDMIGAAKGFFKEGSAGYKTLEATEKAFRAVQLALAIKNMLTQIGLIGTHVAAKVVGDGVMAASDTARSGVEQANSLATTAVKAVEAVVNAIKSLPFPANIIAGAATAAAIATLGVAAVGGFGGSIKVDPGNTGTGTVLGDTSAKSDSIKNAIDALKDVDKLTNVYSRQMSDSLRSIDSQIGNLAAVLVRSGDINADGNVTQGFKTNAIGSVLGAIPLIGGFLSSLFGTRTDVTASGLYGGAQSVGSILNGGYNAQSYSDVTKTSKFLGIVTGRKSSTVFGSVDPALADQFTLILKSFNDAIVAASGPLGVATSDIQNKLNSFVVNIGKIDLKGLTGEQIQDKLNAVFGAAADDMANAAFPGIQQFQKVGEGAFETLVRVSSTVESVTTALDQMGGSAQKLSVAAKLGLADQFDSIGDFTSAVSGYFTAYYSKEEQAAAKTAQFTKVFDSLGLKMPATLDAFRALVEAQDLTTAAGQSAYATLIQLAPAFADLQQALAGAKSAADIVSEREDLQRQLLELQGDTAALRALDLAKIDPSNRALQQQVWALSDAQDAAKNAKSLADAWKSVGDTILDEIKRIRGLTDTGTDGGFASLLGQFNAATASARGGDQDAAKSLPALSQSLLAAAANAATSRQELDRIRAQTAASLQATYGVISSLTKVAAGDANPSSVDAAGEAAGSSSTAPANDDMADEIKALRDELAAMRSDMNAGNATIAGNTGKTAKILDTVTAPSSGQAISVASAA